MNDKVKSRDTGPEMLLRKALWKKGFRYRVCVEGMTGKPDIVFEAKKIAVFVDGDFWHGIQWRKRNLDSLEDQFRDAPKRSYWLTKIRRNMNRDCEVTRSLLSEGWTILRFWESDIVKDIDKCVEVVLQTYHNGALQRQHASLPEKSFAEFFAGIGLMRIGLERHGWTPQFANDIDPLKEAMYTAQFKDNGSIFLLEDIHKIRANQVPQVTLATASFPCNDLSLAGMRQGLKGKNSGTYWPFVEILAAMGSRRPPMLLIENVTGFLTSHHGSDFKTALVALNEIGYVVDSFIIDAGCFVPQSRQRLFIVGILESCLTSMERSSDQGRFSEGELRPKALANFILDHPEIAWRITNLPPPPQRSLALNDLLEDLPDHATEWWSEERTDYLLHQMSPRHREVAQGMIEGPLYSFGTVFRRIRNKRSMAELRTDGIAGCLRTPRGGSGRQILVKAGKGRFLARLLTPRECARLMGAGDYHIDMPLNQALFGFGDAVCVPVIEWIAKYYLDPLVMDSLRGQPMSSGAATD
jgi:DNA (cytosine-5)-methyltransferase 1